MPKFNAHVIFCDDVRREEGGAMSLMGVYGSVAQRLSEHPLRLGCVVVINCEIGEDISGLKVELVVHVDEESSPSLNAFPALPQGRTRPDAVTAKFIERFEGSPPGGAPMTSMVGILQAEGIEFERSCLFSTRIDGQEIGRLVFFKEDRASAASSVLESAPKRSRKVAAPKSAAGKKATTKRKRSTSQKEV
ncbi:hypothetical protein [Stenotrophomonas geniculata]|uniref:hypothetical protein n=1 Tax=Stenotrophomonas geniculata TaxID=86188 RepID=UPI00383B39A3